MRKPIYGLMAEFESPEALLAAARKTHDAGYKSIDAFSPIPIEGLAEAVGFGLVVAAVLNPVLAIPKTELPVRADTPATAPAASEPVRPPRAAATVLGVSKPMLSVHADAPTTTFGVSEPMRPPRADAAATVLGVPESERPTRVAAAGTVLAVLALLAPVLLLPGLAWGAAGRLRPAWYPAAWLAAARSLDASPAHGSVLLLPWATYRTPSWNHGEAVFDPWSKLLSRPVIWNDGTRVGNVALLPDDPRARRLDAAIDTTEAAKEIARALRTRSPPITGNAHPHDALSCSSP